MTYAPMREAMQAIREAVLGVIGSLRAIDAGDYRDDLLEFAAEEELQRRAAVGATPFRVVLRSLTKNAATPSVRGDRALYDMEVEIVTSRSLGPLEHSVNDSRADLYADAMLDAEVLRQALTTGPNLSRTSDNDDTGICGGAMIYDRSSVSPRLLRVAQSAARLETRHIFRAIIQSRPEV